MLVSMVLFQPSAPLINRMRVSQDAVFTNIMTLTQKYRSLWISLREHKKLDF